MRNRWASVLRGGGRGAVVILLLATSLGVLPARRRARRAPWTLEAVTPSSARARPPGYVPFALYGDGDTHPDCATEATTTLVALCAVTVPIWTRKLETQYPPATQPCRRRQPVHLDLRPPDWRLRRC